MRPLTRSERNREAMERAALELERERVAVIVEAQRLELEAILAANGGRLPTLADDTQ